MKTIYRILLPLIMAFGAIAAGCTEQFDTPPSRVAATDADLTGEGYEISSIRALKQVFEREHPDYTTAATSFNIGVPIPTDSLVAIKGRVISTDYFGNVYRTLYVLDASELPEGEEPEAIEIKIGLTGMFVDYQPGDVIYVKTNGLVLGNYRYNLSLGSTFEANENSNIYSNGYIDLKSEVLDRIKRGAKSGSLPPVDTLVFNASNIGDFKDPEHLGRLIRLEGAVSVLGTAESGTPGFSNTDVYPSFLQQKGSGKFADGTYVNYIFTDVIDEWKAYEADPSGTPPASPRPGKMFPTWAFSNDNNNESFYGSALFSVGSSYFVVRSSGYSNFALEALPFEYEITRDADGNIIDVAVTGNKPVESLTGIVTKYSSSSGSFQKYQILLNSSRDVVYDRSGNPR